MSATPLKGLKVLEFTHTIMGPTAGLLLAELGADVIKIEQDKVQDQIKQEAANVSKDISTAL